MTLEEKKILSAFLLRNNQQRIGNVGGGVKDVVMRRKFALKTEEIAGREDSCITRSSIYLTFLNIIRMIK
jgi:hypothetical protein